MRYFGDVNCVLYFFLIYLFFIKKKSGDSTHNPEKGRCQCLTPFLRATKFPSLSHLMLKARIATVVKLLLYSKKPSIRSLKTQLGHNSSNSCKAEYESSMTNGHKSNSRFSFLFILWIYVVVNCLIKFVVYDIV